MFRRPRRPRDPRRLSGPELVARLAATHEEVTLLFSAVLGVPIGDPERDQLVRRAGRLLVEHDDEEERLLYPVLREASAQGAALWAEARRGHVETELLLRGLRPLDARAPGFDRQVALLHEQVTGHMHWEEAHVFPVARQISWDGGLSLRSSRRRLRRSRSRTALRPGPQLLRDPYAPPEPSLRERLRRLLTPPGGSSGLRPH